jgi:hypothetical protein
MKAQFYWGFFYGMKAQLLVLVFILWRESSVYYTWVRLVRYYGVKAQFLPRVVFDYGMKAQFSGRGEPGRE